MIEFQNVSYAHGKGYGVNNLNMTIDDGDFTFLIGPTGSGKTTLMRLIYFDILPDTGQVMVNRFKSSSISEQKISKVRKSIGMVFQDYRLIPDKTVFENIALPLQIEGQTKKNIQHRVHEIIEKVGKRVEAEMESSEDSRSVEKGVKKFIEWIRSGKLIIKAYDSQKIHAKLYIMTFGEGDRDDGRVITGSSNFTRSGLIDNLEFNVELTDPADYNFAKNKFDELFGCKFL